MTKEECIEWFKTSPFYHENHEPFNMAIEALQSQKTGKWQKYEGRFDYDWECSECGCSSYEKTDWCAHCGARMECKEE